MPFPPRNPEKETGFADGQQMLQIVDAVDRLDVPPGKRPNMYIKFCKPGEPSIQFNQTLFPDDSGKSMWKFITALYVATGRKYIFKDPNDLAEGKRAVLMLIGAEVEVFVINRWGTDKKLYPEVRDFFNHEPQPDTPEDLNDDPPIFEFKDPDHDNYRNENGNGEEEEPELDPEKINLKRLNRLSYRCRLLVRYCTDFQFHAQLLAVGDRRGSPKNLKDAEDRILDTLKTVKEIINGRK